MGIGRRVPVVLASALAITMVGGVAAAVSGHSGAAKACVTSNGSLRLRGAGGNCGSGQSAITVNAPGPAGPRGAQGPVGPAGTAQRINFSQATVEASTVTHDLATAGPVSLIATCAGTASAPSLSLALTGGTDAVTYTATETVVDSGAAADVTEVHNTTTALANQTFATDSTSGSRADLINIEISTPEGTQIIGTLNAEVSTAVGAAACTVGGALSAS